MRNRKTLNGLETTVITGTYGALISICIKDNSVNKKNFLGFEILREDLTEKERYPLKGFKYFPQSAKKLAEGQLLILTNTQSNHSIGKTSPLSRNMIISTR